MAKPRTGRSPARAGMLLMLLTILLCSGTGLVEAVTDCNQAVQSGETFTSPGYPDDLLADQTCSYTLVDIPLYSTAYVGTVVFTEFNIPADENGTCTPDTYVEVLHEDFTTGLTTSERYCGNVLPENLTAVSSVQFVSGPQNYSGSGYGFKAVYSKQFRCGDTYKTDDEGYIQMPSDNYEQLEGGCTWTIRVQENHTIWFVFGGYLYLLETDGCQAEYINIYDGPQKTLIGSYCGMVPQGIVMSTSNVLTVEFYTNGSTMSLNYASAYYTARSSSDCGFMQLTDQQGSFGLEPLSLGTVFSSLWRNGLCLWNISVQQGDVIQLTLDEFILNGYSGYYDAAGCGNSSLSVFDGFTTDESRLIARLCGHEYPWLITSTSNNLVLSLTLQEMSGFTSVQFRASYKAVNSTAVNTTCGGRISGEGGRFASPNYPNYYDDNLDCTWLITADPGFVLQLSLEGTWLELLNATRCVEDSLQIRDGDSMASPLLGGPFCEQDGSWMTFTSTGSSMLVKLVTNDAGTSTGFQATWSRVCEKTIDDDKGTVQSPNFPNSYPEDTYCTYRFGYQALQPGYHYVINFTAFDLEPAVNGSCVNDYVEVDYVWQNTTATFVDPLHPQTYCGNSLPEQMTFYSPAEIRFVSNNYTSAAGFQLTYELLRAECGPSLLMDSEGTVTSPGHPGSFPSYINCTWTIQVGDSDTITLLFNSFSMGTYYPGEDCFLWKDGAVVSVYDGDTDNGTRLGVFCGDYYFGSRLTSTKNTMTLMFQSWDNYNHWTGFSASYLVTASMCERTIDDDKGTVQSPNFPNSYPEDTNCTYRFGNSYYTPAGYPTLQPGYHYVITFTAFDLEPAVNGSCVNDFVEIDYFWQSTTAAVADPLQTQRFCGNSLPEQLTVNSSAQIRFVSNNYTSAAGFQLTYELLRAECGPSLLTDSEGTVTSPGHPGSFPSYSNCTWTIQVGDSDNITLFFNSFSMGNSLYYAGSDCLFWNAGAMVSVYDGDTDNGTLIGRFCGDYYSGSRLTSTNNTMTLVFESWDNYNHWTGFSASYLVTGSECGYRELTAAEGDVGLPSYSDYWPNGVCVWNITVSPDHLVELTIHTLYGYNTLWSSNCSTSFLEVLEVSSGVETTLARLCLYDSPWLIRSTTSTMVLRLVLGDQGGFISVSFSGRYRAVRADQVNNNCGGELTGARGELSSPDYPNLYGNQMECQWLITVDPAFTLNLQIYDIDLDSNYSSPIGSGCSDSLQIRDGDSMLSPMLTGLLCGHHQRYDFFYPLMTFSPQSNQVMVKFVTDEIGTAQGFNMTWTSVCERTIDDDKGTVQSPNFPNSYPEDTNCTYRFGNSYYSPAGYPALQPGYHYVINFTAFDLEPAVNGSCVNDFVEIDYFWQSTTAAVADPLQTQRFCGNSLPEQLTVNSSAQIRFVSNNHTSAAGFQLTYELQRAECGPSLMTDFEGTVTSPGHPGSFPSYSNCTWTIQVGDSDNITLFFDSFSMGGLPFYAGSECLFWKEGAMVSVYDGDTDNGTLIGRFCGDYYSGSRLTSTNNTMTLVFESWDNYNHWTGFSASYLVTGSECGYRELTAAEGDVGLPSYSDYWPNGVCVWNITVSPDHLVELTIHTLYGYNTLWSSNCSTSFLKVVELSSGVETTLARLCLYDSPWLIRSTTSTMVLRLVLGEQGGFTSVSFTGRYRAVRADQVNNNCGGELTGARGELSSPDYPILYGNQMECQWLITVDPAFTLNLQIYDIDLDSNYSSPTGSGCSDSLQIRDGDSMLSPMLTGLLCGHHQRYDFFYPLMTFSPQSNQVMVKFVTDEIGTAQGFNMTWTSVCERTIDDDKGTVQSPNFPNSYPEDTYCTYRFGNSYYSTSGYPALQPGYHYVINFTAFDLEPAVNGSCVNDYVEIDYFWQNTTATVADPLQTQRFCGNSLPEQLTVNSSAEIRFVSNNHTSAAGFQLTYELLRAECGPSLLTDSEGTVTSPGHPGSFPSYSKCTWTIQVGDSDNITLFFDSFSMGSLPSYAGSYCVFWNAGAMVSVYDGDTDNGTLIGRFCGDYYSGSRLTSTNNTMTLVFESWDNYNHWTGFSASYLVTGSECGYRELTAAEGNVGLPSYSDYWPNGVCVWNITVSPDHLVELTIHTLYTFWSHNCSTNFLEVLEISFGVESTLARLCLYDSPWLIRSTTSTMVLRLVLGEQGGFTSVSFTGRYRAVRADQVNNNCGGELTGARGELSSPDYPNLYGNQMECQWLITVDPAFTLNLQIYDIDLDSNYSSPIGSGCSDSLQIRDGDSMLSPMLTGLLCGHHQRYDFFYPLMTFSPQSNQVMVKFVTDEIGTAQGFNMTWTSVCERTIDDDKGTVQSSNFPNSYPEDTNCTYRFGNSYYSPAGYPALQPGYHYVINFTAFDLEPAVNGSCVNDYVEIDYFWQNTTATVAEPLQTQRYCGNSLPEQLTVNSSAEIRFVSNSHTSAAGFQLTYELLRAECGPSLLTDSEGTVTSPGHPGSFPSYSNCTWTIQVGDSDNITLFFDSFSMGNSLYYAGSDCLFWNAGAMVSIYDGDTDNGTLIGRFCGDYYPGSRLTSTSNTMTLVFESWDNYNHWTGFSASYIVTGSECGYRELTAAEGDVGLPSYSDYWPNGVCVWNITVSPDHLVELTIHTLYTFWSSNCSTSFLEVQEVSFGVETTLARLCLYDSPWLIRSTTSTMVLRLVLGEQGGFTSVSFTGRYRAVRADQVNNNCGGELTGARGELSSPDYPILYGNQMECQWLITVDPAFTLNLQIYDIDLDSNYSSPTGSGCSDSLQIRDGVSMLSPMLTGLLCGHHQRYDFFYPLMTFSPQSNQVMVKFVTDEIGTAQGFNMTWTSVCERTIDDDKGTVQSPNFPNSYPEDTYCTYRFGNSYYSPSGYPALQPGYHYVINFTAFDLEPAVNGSCVNDYVEIDYFWQNTTATVADQLQTQRFCGNSLPEQLTVNSSAEIRFVSNNHTSAAGFQLTYELLRAECGPSLLTDSEGTVTSPGHPGSFPSYSKCTWTIQVGDSDNITLFFDSFSMGDLPSYAGSDCFFWNGGAMVSVYDGDTDNGTLIGRFCGDYYSGSRLTSTNNTMTLVFESWDNYNHWTGFSASYLVTGSECGYRELTAAEGNVGLPSYSDYWPNGVCVWNITVSPDHLVELTIHTLYTFWSHNCSTNFLEVLEISFGVESTLARLCLYDSPWLIRSTTSTMVLRLVLGEQGGFTSVSFTGRYRAVRADQVNNNCGGELTGARGELSSPDYPNLYGNQMECQWLITVDPAFTLNLQIYDIDLDSNYSSPIGSGCSDSLQIRDGDSMLSPMLTGLLCGHHQRYDFFYPLMTFSPQSNQVMVKFVTDEIGTAQGFNMTWTSVCERTIDDDKGTVQSPNFPNSYPEDTYCTYRFGNSYYSPSGYPALQPGYHYVINFTAFDLEPAVNGSCVNDYVEIDYFWQNTTAAVADPLQTQRFCGNSLPEQLTVNSSAEIRFVSNNHTTAAGFQLTYELQRAECGPSLLTDSEGTVTSPGHPGSFPSYSKCTWTIQVGDSDNITLFFDSFSMGDLPSYAGSDCFFWNGGAMVSVYDGDTDNGTLIGRFCGDYYSGSRLTSTNNTMTLVFESWDNYNHWTGFSASYLVTGSECGYRELTAAEGDVGLPSYSDYWPNGVCVWNITVSPDHLVELTIHTLYGYNTLWSSNCSTSFLEVLELSSGVETTLARLCLHDSPWLIRSTTSTMVLRLVLGEQGGFTSVSFSGRYRAVRADQVNNNCGGELTGARGELSSPDYPNLYGNQMECQWLITVDPAFTLNLQIYDIDLDSNYSSPIGSGCSDSLQIRDGVSMLSPMLTGLLCGHHQRYDFFYPLMTFSPQSNQVMVKFVTDEIGTAQGFNMTWTSVCERTIDDDKGTVQSPNFPNSYPEHTYCTYRFGNSYYSPSGYPALQPGYHYVINFTAFDLEPAVNGSCVNDYVEIDYFWQNTTAAVADPLQTQRFCGNSLPEQLTVNSSAEIRFVSNNYTSAAGFQLTYELLRAECGPSLLTDSEGTVTSPGHPGSFPSYSNCTWTIQVGDSDNITLFFDSFSMGNSLYYAGSGCLFWNAGAMVSIYDGDTDNGTLIGRFCGDYYSGSRLTSTKNTMTLVFESWDNYNHWTGFSASYLVTGSECGYRELTAAEGDVGLPSNQWPNGVCVWNITVSPDHLVELTIHTLYGYNTLWSSNCSTSFLEVLEDSSGVETTLARLCLHDSPWLIRSTTSTMVLRMVLGEQGGFTSVSFSGRYRAVRADQVNNTCGGTLTGASGEISSPNFPGPYDNQLDCQWLIVVDPALGVHLELFSLDLEGICTHDSLQIRDGNNMTAPYLLPPTCGRYIFDYYYYDPSYPASSQLYQSSGNAILLKFVTNDDVTGMGFNATWTAVCDRRTIDSEKGSVQSPGYPNSYPNDIHCEYYFPVSEPGFRFVFEFTSLDLENASSNGSCVFDYVEIQEDQVAEAGQRFCGSSGTPDPVTVFHSAYVRFVTNSNITAIGYHLNYTRLAPECGDSLIRGQTGSISSPNFPGPFPQYFSCRWTIEVEEGQIVKLVFDRMDMSYGFLFYGDCGGYGEGAVVSVYDGSNTTDSVVLGSYCSETDTIAPVISSGNVLTLVFESWRNYNYWTGFQASFTAVETVEEFRDCGGSVEGTEGVLMSPHYPEHYPNNSLCRWFLTADPGDRVRVTFSAFDLEDSIACQADYLELRDGPDEFASQLDRLCGGAIPFSVTSTSNVMFVEFASDVAQSYSGFKADWISLCEETYSWSSGTFQSPTYPDSYGSRKQCTYILQQWEGYIVRLQFTDFNLGDSTDCQGQYIEIRDGGYDGSPLLGRRYCGDTLPPVWTSSSNMMWVRYVTDGSSNNTQFQATYSRESPSCGTSTLTEKRGTFATPLYPSNYPRRVECTWEIMADTTDVIRLTFDTFTLEGPYYCPYDWVKIYDGDTLLGTWCQLSAPDTITTSSPGNTLRVVFKSDCCVTYEGFSASYLAYDPYSDELSRQYDLYPYGKANGDLQIPVRHDKSKKFILDTGFPVANELEYKIFIGNKGLVSFGRRDKGRKLMLKSHKKMICPYLSDIGAGDSFSGVYYQLHTDNQAVLDKASREVREFTEFKQYSASLVLVVTWDRVAHINSHNATEERATVQLALISDGRRSFGLVFYKAGAMRWSVLDNEPLIIGFSNGHLDQVVSNVYSNTTEAFTKMDRIKGNTGRYGMWIYPIGDSYSADQECQDWHRRNLPQKEERLAGFQRLPQCPCSWWWLWGNWRWAYWRDDYNVMCFRMTVGRSRQLAPYGKECCYNWDWWWWSTWGQYLTDAPHAGSATAYNPAFWSLRTDYQREDRRAHDVCCYNTTNPDYYCNKYYELRPVGECSTRIPFSFSWTWGDPHIKTLDGGEYTFNGLGEYTMITLTSGDLSFTLQGRTGLAETESGSVTNATVFTAFGAEENGVRVFVGLDPNTNDSLIIYANDTDYSTAFRDAGDDEILVDSENYMLKRSNQSFVVTFASEIQMTISIGYKALDISISMPLDYRGMTQGLLGNFNGVTGDDFVLPDGTTLASDLTDRQIYEDFGPQWAVTSSNTVLRYGPREGPADFAHPEFKPIFLDEVPAATRQAADDLCGATNVACVYDYVATGSAAIANSSKATADSAAEREKVTQNTVPVLLFNSTINGTSGETLTFNLQGHDPDTGDLLTYYVVDDGDGAVQVDSATGDVTLAVNSTKPVSFSFYVKDSNNAQSPTRDVMLIACSGCNGHGTCDFFRTTTSSVTRGFQIAACDCLPAWTGTDCQDDYDACDESPCDAYQVCTDLTPEQQGGSDVGYTCTGCPDGFDVHPVDATRCVDIDECSQQHNCSMLCNNLPGSYRCDCRDGYRLNGDDVSCDDVNECVDRTDGCQQDCVNNDGSFLCQCRPGYTLSAKGTCEADNTTADLCSTAGCDHGCTSTTDPAGNPVAQCFCNSGYKLDPSNNSSCVDRDECQEGVCSQSCVNTQGSFVCTCYVGNVMGSDQRTCNPCTSLRYGVECRKTCSCNGRMRACDPVTGCVCQKGWTGSECQRDVDECAEDPDVCGEGKLCFNTNGSYACRCPQGYAEDSQGACSDIDECSEESMLNTCGELEQCHNVPGSHYCTCNKGYTRRNGQCTDINECEGSQNQCQQLCNNVPGSYNCDCRYGFRLDQDRASCSQVADVCKDFEGLECDHGCSLDDSDRAFCFCHPGYKLATDLQTCLDEDECSLGTSGCSDVSLCVNTDGGYNCSCPLGQMLDNDRKTCLPCPADTYGENCAKLCACGIGASYCDAITGCVCKSGWTGERCDQDIDECQTVQTQAECLAQSARCVNSQGGYACRCSTGFMKNASNICEDVNECDNSPCSQQCENSLGSYRCLCNKGYSFNTDTGTCEDVDECSLSVTNLCTQRCDNTPGSYRCSCNVSGYSLNNDGFTCTATASCNRTDCPTEDGGCSQEQCFCNNGYQLTASNTCEWIDEDLCAGSVCQQTCSESSDGRSFICSCQDGYLLNEDQRTCRVCPAGTFGPDCSGSCTCNTQNSVSCDHVNGTCNCTAGWEGNACDVDIDECTAPPGVTCPANSNCINTAGSYVCACETGYYKDSSGLCQECAPNSYGENCAQQCTCTSNAQSCNNVNGACSCKAGWEGTRCETDVNECLTNQHNCSGDHVICINQGGGYSCGCESGFKYNGTACLDVDECLADTDDCDQVCNNTVGSFTCSCGPGYLGTGNDCRELTRVPTVVTVQITAPADLSNPYGATYALWMQLAEEALYNTLKASVPGLRAVIIISLRLGSLIVDSEIVLNNETSPEATSDLTLALIDLSQSLLTIGNETGIVGLNVSGTVLSSSMSVCDVYETVTDCQTGTQCYVTDGVPSCRPIKDEDNTETLMIALAVAIPVAIVLVGIVVTVVLCKKKAIQTVKTGPLMVNGFRGTAPAGTSFGGPSKGRVGSVDMSSPAPSFNSLPSSRKGSWTLDF